MNIATSENIREIDLYAEERLGISARALMGRAGEAVADAVRELSSGGNVIILAGKGNNGGDGYAAALSLSKTHAVTVYDVFGGGQRSEAGKYYLDGCVEQGVKIVSGELPVTPIDSASVIVDAVFGTGYSGSLSDKLQYIADTVNASDAAVVAVDIPLGIDADSGELSGSPVRAHITVALTLPKPAHLLYPAREYMGRVKVCSLGLDGLIGDSGAKDANSKADTSKGGIPFKFSYHCIDKSIAAKFLPKRAATSNKGSFGKTLHLTGSEKYRGAAHLALEASLRTGVGLVGYLGAVSDELRLRFPEAIYENLQAKSDTVSQICEISRKYTTTLIGSGSGVSEELYNTVKALLATRGGALIIDADGINSLAAYGSAHDLKGSSRPVVLTPHPLELSRLTGLEVGYINSHRLNIARQFAAEHGVILLLKGAGTVITDGNRAYINTTGSTALSKGGSGDVLSGVIASLAAQTEDTLTAAALAAYLHGAAGDSLSKTLSDFGVTPSDLPIEIAKQINGLVRHLNHS